MSTRTERRGRWARTFAWVRRVRSKILTWFRGPPHTRPTTLEEAIDAIEGQRQVSAWKSLAIALLIVSLPLVVWISVTIGERAREANCRSTERALVQYAHDDTIGLRNASEQSKVAELGRPLTAEEEEALDAATADYIADRQEEIREQMGTCQ